ncbi:MULTISPECIES: phage terminase large subunit [Sphingomonas]|uniref:phage terminase large subunit n=1 Tax=Sphingomonas TaxID=13687 RepID=UPI000F7E3BC3|nr:phage terminase large subunit [Sphingomonas sp. ABOLF]RSV14631.1 hypothetical protein CA235_11165 [Sphingomonas sp. ABOLF]GLK19233.1 hypothetical protein GCM10017606_00590 [Microbacterium terregens]
MATLKPVHPNISTFQPKHLQLFQWIADPTVRNILAAGGVRSGKTITEISGMFFRAMRAPGSTHGFFHAQRNICERNLFKTSFPETLDILMPGWYGDLKAAPENYVNQADLTVRLPNGSKFLFMGLDDPDKVRGLKFSTIMLNEANFVDYKTVMTLRGRLSESVATLGPTGKQDGPPLETKMLFDLNPTFKSSWDYQVFVEGLVPGERRPIPNHDKTYRYLIINAIDNKPNLPESLFEDFESMTEEQRRRDEHGMWTEDNPHAMFNLATIQRAPFVLASLVEIVIAIDPAGTANKNSDSTGLIVAGRDAEGRLYVLEDATMKAKPDDWIAEAIRLRKKYDAKWILTEKNYGRDILESLLFRIAPNEPHKFVDAMGRGKQLRASPVATMYDRGRVTHARVFPELEQQMIEFDSPHFRGSPDRVDALVYALTHLSGERGAGPMRAYKLRGFMGA